MAVTKGMLMMAPTPFMLASFCTCSKLWMRPMGMKKKRVITMKMPHPNMLRRLRSQLRNLKIDPV